MAKTLDDAIVQIRMLLAEIEGIRQVPDEPIEQANAYIYGHVFPKRGEWMPISSAFNRGVHTIGLEIFTARKDLPRDIARVKPIAERVKDKFLIPANICLPDSNGDATVNEINALRYEFVPDLYGGGNVLGYQFELDITIKGN